MRAGLSVNSECSARAASFGTERLRAWAQLRAGVLVKGQRLGLRNFEGALGYAAAVSRAHLTQVIARKVSRNTVSRLEPKTSPGAGFCGQEAIKRAARDALGVAGASTRSEEVSLEVRYFIHAIEH